MPIMVKRVKKQYEIPKPGQVNARLVEVKELGEVQTKDGPKEKVAFIWQTGARDSKGQNFDVHQRMNKSIHPMSDLFRAIVQITGTDPGDEFDLATLVGTDATLVLVHNEDKHGIIWANVAAIVRPPTPAEEASERRVTSAVEAVKAGNSAAAGTVATTADSPITGSKAPF